MTLVGIQILRATAALMVVWHHARHEGGELAGRTGGSPLDPATLLPWWAGVDLFFVISGFVVVHASRDLFGASGGRGLFLAHRAARVVPLYWLATALYGAVALAAPALLGGAGALARDPGYVAASFLFWPAARPDGSVQPLYGLGWTLNCEVFFYALLALWLGRGRNAAVAGLSAALAALVAAAAFFPLPLPLAFWGQPVVLEFAAGAGLALIRGRGVGLRPEPRLVLAALGSGGLLLAALRVAGAGEADGFARPILVGLPALLLVAAAALGTARDRAEIAALPAPARWLSALGDASYALYLVHPFALRLAREVLVRLGPGPSLPPWGPMAAMAAASVAAALLVHRVIERPLTRALRARLENRVRGGRPGSLPRLGPLASPAEDATGEGR